MKLRLADIAGQRRKAEPGLSGACPCCGAPVIARCGKIRAWHWPHRSVRVCDPWWENETEWHRAWKNEFPTDWQEIIQTAENGERHIADVKTETVLRDWNASLAAVYFDLGVPQEDKQQFLWRRDPIRRNGQVYLTPVPREIFLKMHREGHDWEAQLSKGIDLIVEDIQRASQPPQQSPPPPTRPSQPRSGAWGNPYRRRRHWSGLRADGRQRRLTRNGGQQTNPEIVGKGEDGRNAVLDRVTGRGRIADGHSLAWRNFLAIALQISVRGPYPSKWTPAFDKNEATRPERIDPPRASGPLSQRRANLRARSPARVEMRRPMDAE